jgi:ADP-ribose pyrophosphatase YjhB (NUDIX family)
MNIIEYKERIQQPLRQTTLCFLTRDDEVLLAMKKRGFGKDRWNGVGGKPNPGENIDQTAVRETQEEIDVTLKDIEVRAVLDFYFSNNPDWSQQVIVYFSKSWDGIPKETEEMKPSWYKKNDLPLNEMWPDDKHWLPQVLDGSRVKAEFLFGENDNILDFSVRKVESLNI